MRQKRGGARIASSKSEAVADLMLEVAQFFFRIRAVGQKTGLITGWGGGAFGFMRSLALLGPLTVPQIAEMRPTSRQRMQRLADELAAEGLVEFVDNPKHRRSKLVQLKPKGEARYREWNVRFLAIGSTMGVDLSEADIRRTTEIVRRLSDEVKAQSEEMAWKCANLPYFCILAGESADHPARGTPSLPRGAGRFPRRARRRTESPRRSGIRHDPDADFVSQSEPKALTRNGTPSDERDATDRPRFSRPCTRCARSPE